MSLDVFQFCGVVFHLGHSPHSGHYRTGLRFQDDWLLYDDGKLPDRVHELLETVYRNCILHWLVRPDPENVRTMNEAGPEIPILRSAASLHPRW